MSWPVGNDIYGTLHWLRREVGGSLGYGYDSGTWGSDKIGLVDSCIQSGLMQFYFPIPAPAAEGQRPNSPHQWSFLSPLATIDFVAGTDTYGLPNDFSGVIGDFSYVLAGETKRIPVVPEATLRQLRTSSPRSGTPFYAAARPKQSDGTAQQSWEVLFYPCPSESAQVEFRHSVSPRELSEDRPYPLGGRQYAEVILQSCLAVSEERVTKARGAATEKYLERLAAATSWDTQSINPTDSDVWPLEDKPEGLQINRAYLKRMVGREMQIGSHPKAWNHKQAQEVDMYLQSGLRNFYHPQVLPGEKNRHEWSFLRPMAQMMLTLGQNCFDLPANFSILEGSITFAPDQYVSHLAIALVGELSVRKSQQTAGISGRPRIAATRPKPPSVVGTRYELIVYPTPDQDYEVLLRYQVNPDAGAEDGDTLLGGQPHAQTIIESCLAAVEQGAGKAGIHGKQFMELLRSSVSHDRCSNSCPMLGYNGDVRMVSDGEMNWRDCQDYFVTYNGERV